MGIGDTGEIKGAGFVLLLNQLLEFLQFSSAAQIKEILLIVAVVGLVALLHC